MAREIKFRAYSKVDKLMFVNIHEGITFPDKSQYTFDDFLKNTGYHEWEIMQFTGLRLKDVDIFEGDLIGFAGKYVYQVRFEDGKFVLRHAKKQHRDYGKWGDLCEIFSHKFNECDFAVIGNIHQHGHLLE